MNNLPSSSFSPNLFWCQLSGLSTYRVWEGLKVMLMLILGSGLLLGVQLSYLWRLMLVFPANIVKYWWEFINKRKNELGPHKCAVLLMFGSLLVYYTIAVVNSVMTGLSLSVGAIDFFWLVWAWSLSTFLEKQKENRTKRIS